MSKVCEKCKEEKTDGAFYIDLRAKDRLYSVCKECHVEIIRKFEAKYREKNRMRNYENRRKWVERNKESFNLKLKEYRKKNKKKTLARDIIKRAIIKEELVRPEFCERYPFLAPEGCNGRVEAHHEDYNKPLEIKWLCSRHHGLIHRSN